MENERFTCGCCETVTKQAGQQVRNRVGQPVCEGCEVEFALDRAEEMTSGSYTFTSEANAEQFAEDLPLRGHIGTRTGRTASFTNQD